MRESVGEIYGQAYHVFERPIEQTIKVAECPAAGMSILQYAPKNPAAESYRSLAQEVLQLAYKMNDLLKRRMTAAQQASELQASDEAYEKLFRQAPPDNAVKICDLPLDKLVPFFTADIGFKPYPPAKWKAFAQQLAEEGLLERIIVRPIPSSDCYEILAGHNRTESGRLAGWKTIPAEIVAADDERAIVAEFFGVTEYEIRKAIKLTFLIPQLQDILVDQPKQLNLACAELIADYNEESQAAFVEICSIEGYSLNKATVKQIIHCCPPPTADRQAVFAAWREARAAAERRGAGRARRK